jgi:antitoxin component YwqK of YwqJK toxin-antitoxin module
MGIYDAMSARVEGKKMTSKNLSLKSLMVVLVMTALGCASATGAEKRDGKAGDSNATVVSENIRQKKSGNELETETDLNGDKKPDVFTYTVKAKSAEGKDIDRLVRKELDINADGKIDISRTYDEREQISREALDLDFDSKVDQVNFYEKGVIVRKERDLSSGGKPSLWLFFEKGKLVRKERDTNGDGRVDYWEYWENEQVDRIGEDLDGDGNVDKWTKNPDSET